MTEVIHQYDRTLGHVRRHLHYEIMATGQVFDGDSEVMVTTGSPQPKEGVPISESPLSDVDAAVLAHIYAALADPVRLKLLSLIAASGELCSCDLVEPLAESQPTVSHHTKILAEVGLITGDKRGRWTYWSVSPTRTRFVTELLGSAVAAV